MSNSLLNSSATKNKEEINATKSALKFNIAVSFFEYSPVPRALQNKAFPVANRVDKAKMKYLFTKLNNLLMNLFKNIVAFLNN